MKKLKGPRWIYSDMDFLITFDDATGFVMIHDKLENQIYDIEDKIAASLIEKKFYDTDRRPDKYNLAVRTVKELGGRKVVKVEEKNPIILDDIELEEE